MAHKTDGGSIMHKTRSSQRQLRWLRVELTLMLCLASFLGGLIFERARSETEPWPGLGQLLTRLSSAIGHTAPDEPLYMEYGTDTALNISTDGFTDPGTKNAHDLAAFAEEAWRHRWGYVWGTFGRELDEALLAEKCAQYPDGVGGQEAFIRAHWLGHRAADCIGLLKAYCWFEPDTGGIGYATGAMPDIGTDDLYEAASEKGPIDTIPEIPGVIVYAEGHVGIYIGDGYVIDAKDTETGVVKTKLSQRHFTHWLKCPYISYD